MTTWRSSHNWSTRRVFLNNWLYGPLTLPILRLLSSKAQGREVFWKPFKPCNVGIFWMALAEYSQMSTHVPGFPSFFRLFASFCVGKMNHQPFETRSQWQKAAWQFWWNFAVGKIFNIELSARINEQNLFIIQVLVRVIGSLDSAGKFNPFSLAAARSSLTILVTFSRPKQSWETIA